LRSKIISLVKVLWRNQHIEEATWELEEEMRKDYPRLFQGTLSFVRRNFYKEGRM